VVVPAKSSVLSINEAWLKLAGDWLRLADDADLREKPALSLGGASFGYAS